MGDGQADREEGIPGWLASRAWLRVGADGFQGAHLWGAAPDSAIIQVRGEKNQGAR